jgi:hypothetical protein
VIAYEIDEAVHLRLTIDEIEREARKSDHSPQIPAGLRYETAEEAMRSH